MSDEIVGILNGFFQALLEWFLILKINNKKCRKLQKILLYFGLFLTLSISGLFIPNQIRFFYFLLTSYLLIYFILKIDLTRSIIISTISIIITSLSELIVTGIFCCIGINSELLIKNNNINFFVNIAVSIFGFIIFIVFYHKILNIYKFLKKKKILIFYIFVILILLYLLVAKNALFSTINAKAIINLGILFIFIILFVIIIINESKSDYLEEINRQSMNFIKKYEKIIAEQGKANHEFKNQLMVIKGYAQMKSPKLLEYLNTLIEDNNKATSTYLISQLNKFPDGGIKGLLYYKLSVMEECKIKYNIYSDEKAKKKFKNLTLEQISNITKIIGVMLDNAIEASEKSRDKSLNISLLNSRGKVNFIVENTFEGNIDIEKIGTGFTTKGKGHGYGLQLTKDIINNKKYLNYSSIINKNVYISNLEIYTGKKTYKK